jgi:hypothetical protein
MQRQKEMNFIKNVLSYPNQRTQTALSPGVDLMQPGRKADPTRLSRGQAKNEWSYTSIAHTSPWPDT